MKILKRALILICVITIMFSFNSHITAFERHDHDKYMLKVLFTNFKEYKNDPSIKDEINALESAAYLTIDQYNSKGENDLKLLLDYGVKDIPKTISLIDYQESPNIHRSHTHRGWDFSLYVKTKEIWPIRKQIMLNTAEAIFDFDGDDAKKDSFCALLYYIHILGDHIDDDSHYKTNGSNGQKIKVGGRTDDYDIIHELLNHIEILFKDQKHTHKYRSLTASLLRYDSKFSKLTNTAGEINTEEEFVKYNQLAKDLMDLLSMYIPEMLKEEQFFSDVFYKK